MHDAVWPSAAQAPRFWKSPRLTPYGCGILYSPPPCLCLSRLPSTVVNFSFFSTLQSPYPPPPPNILIETQGILEVKEPHI